ncbi:MAG TPA: hypothetical protein VJ873_00980, partial [bacterium]|nr:hypothetical protein [bacterium]
VRNQIKQGDIFIGKKVMAPALVGRIKDYLAGIGRCSLPNYEPIREGCPNFHRINYWDERSYVKGCFHQFAFFPWNQDVFNLFELTREVYYMKNLISQNRKDRFLGRTPDEGCVSRLSFQFYPRGIGGMNKHQDPVDFHQQTAPALVMSKRGPDYATGGVYVEKADGTKVYPEDSAEIGDVVYINPQTPHGVEKIDGDAETDWVSFQGRWTMLFAINKVGANLGVPDSVDLEKAPPKAK